MATITWPPYWAFRLFWRCVFYAQFHLLARMVAGTAVLAKRFFLHFYPTQLELCSGKYKSKSKPLPCRHLLTRGHCGARSLHPNDLMAWLELPHQCSSRYVLVTTDAETEDWLVCEQSWWRHTVERPCIPTTTIWASHSLWGLATTVVVSSTSRLEVMCYSYLDHSRSFFSPCNKVEQPLY